MPTSIINDAVSAVSKKLFGGSNNLKHNGTLLKNIASQLVKAKYQHGWQWLLEFENTHGIKPPEDFDIYCKQLEHGGLTYEYEDKVIGANTITSAISKSAGEVTLMIRDHEDARCENFLSKLGKLVINNDGTVNLPNDYLFTLTLYRFSDADERIKYKRWQVSIKSYGGFSRGRDNVGEFVSFEAVFQKYQALSKEE